MATVKIYTTPTCPWCQRTKEFLDDHDVEYQEFNVAEDEDARDEMVEKSEQMGVPVIDIDGEIIVGWQEEALREELDIED